VSAFICANCDNLRDADDGCEEAPDGLSLICVYCAEEAEAEREEAEDRRRANPLEPDFRRL
jgi:hypothetical protein